MFSFGYKNLYTPKPNKPGPGYYVQLSSDYEIGERSFIKISPKRNSSDEKKQKQQHNQKFKKLKNHENCYQEYFPQQTEEKQLKTKTDQSPHYFTASKRSDCFTLPLISKGPQYYMVEEKQLDHSIDIGKYSSRKPLFDSCKLNYSTERCKKELRYNQQENTKSIIQQFPISNSVYQLGGLFPRFREYSYIEKDKYGPRLTTPQNTIGTKKFPLNRLPYVEKSNENFLKSEIQQNSEDGDSDDSFSISDYRKIQEKYFYNRSPQYQFSKADTDKKSYFNRSTEVIKSKSPGPGDYNYKLEKGKHITFSKQQRFKKLFFWFK